MAPERPTESEWPYWANVLMRAVEWSGYLEEPLQRPRALRLDAADPEGAVLRASDERERLQMKPG